MILRNFRVSNPNRRARIFGTLGAAAACASATFFSAVALSTAVLFLSKSRCQRASSTGCIYAFQLASRQLRRGGGSAAPTAAAAAAADAAAAAVPPLRLGPAASGDDITRPRWLLSHARLAVGDTTHLHDGLAVGGDASPASACCMHGGIFKRTSTLLTQL